MERGEKLEKHPKYDMHIGNAMAVIKRRGWKNAIIREGKKELSHLRTESTLLVSYTLIVSIPAVRVFLLKFIFQSFFIAAFHVCSPFFSLSTNYKGSFKQACLSFHTHLPPSFHLLFKGVISLNSCKFGLEIINS